MDDVNGPNTWNVAGSSWVYFCLPERLLGALSDRQLLFCLTRKEKNEWGAGEATPPPFHWVCFPSGIKHFQQQGSDEALRGIWGEF